MWVAMSLQIIAVFAKVLRGVPAIHQCMIESAFVGASFPFLLSAIQTSIVIWFPKSERTKAYAISFMPFALAAVLKFNINFPIHYGGAAIAPIGAVEVLESVFIMVTATLSFYLIKDRPCIYPSFVASLPRSNL